MGRAGLLQPCRNLHSAAKEIAALGEFPSDHERYANKGVARTRRARSPRSPSNNPRPQWTET
ncbi:MAG: hypothetical protein ACLRTQ_03825 [Candidatus Borkfalkia sp.]